MENAACLYQVPAQLVAELAIHTLEDSAHYAVMALPDERQVTLKQIVSHLEGPFGKKIVFLKLRGRFFVRKQQEDENLTRWPCRTSGSTWKRRMCMAVLTALI